jgi:hypothetical protein
MAFCNALIIVTAIPPPMVPTSCAIVGTNEAAAPTISAEC